VSIHTLVPAAASSFQSLRVAWERCDPEKRVSLEPKLSAHMRAYPRDPTSRAIGAMLALVALDQGALDRAVILAKAARSGGAGVVRDDADVVLGAVSLRRGDAAAALQLLRPLDGKVIDPHFRDAFDAELADAAVRTGDAPLALGAMRRWLARTPTAERAPVERRIEKLIARMREDALLAALRAPPPADDDFVEGVLAVRLAQIARERRDAILARFLLDRVPDRLGEDADPIAAIAARASGPTYAPKTVGLLVSTRTTELARRSLDVATGLADALALTLPPQPLGSSASASPAPGQVAPTLLVRDAQTDATQVPDTLARLAADGAGVVIAGFDRADADAVARYATSIRLPVVLLVAPSVPLAPGGRVFVLGEDGATERRALMEAFAKSGRRRIAVLSAVPADVRPTEAPEGSSIVAIQPCGAALDFVRAATADALLVDGGPDCARGAIEAPLARGSEIDFGFGIDAASEPTATGLVASAGLLPIRGETPEPLRAWTSTGRSAPAWWAALGHDAGALADAALRAVGELDAAHDAASVEVRRAKLTAAIASATATLWTTSARGFDGSRDIPRPIEAREVRGTAPVRARAARPERR
jgi:hypothetical protein